MDHPDPEKGITNNSPGRRESIESHPSQHTEDAETSIARGHQQRKLQTPTATNNSDGAFLDPLQSTRSRSSVRSQRSYAGADGYTHFEHDDDNEHHHNGQNGSTARPPGPSVQESKDDTSPDPDPDKTFEVGWDGPSDPTNPKSPLWAPRWRKWTIVLLGALSSMCVTFASALYTSAYSGMERDFHVSRLVVTLGLSTFVAGLGLGPMFLSPLSEFYGRRPVYICAFGMYFIWLIPCALARNLETMLVVRFLCGLSGSAFLSVAGGTVGDTFPKEELSMPMMVYSAAPFCGPLLGPIVGGFVASYKDWRWCFWVLMMWAGVNWLLLFFFVPETYAPVLLRGKARRLRRETGEERWRAPIERLERSVARTVGWSCVRPFQLLFFEPMCLNLCLLSAILLGILYLFFGAFPLVFGNNHGFNLWQTGLTFLGLFLGNVIGVSCDPFWRRNYDRLVRNNGGVSEPEFRLPPTILGAILVPISLFGFGWTTFPWVHWIVPILFSVLFGMGNIFCFSGIFTFLVECYPLYSASALAANSFARSSFAAAFPCVLSIHPSKVMTASFRRNLFGVQMYNNLNYQWASSLLGFIALAMTPFPILFFKYGKRLRGNSRFAQA